MQKKHLQISSSIWSDVPRPEIMRNSASEMLENEQKEMRENHSREQPNVSLEQPQLGSSAHLQAEEGDLSAESKARLPHLGTFQTTSRPLSLRTKSKFKNFSKFLSF